jgi:cysteine desulfurase
MDAPVYLDHNATTPLDPRVLEAMLPWFRERFGNAGSAHFLGLEAEGAVVQARAQVAALLGADPAEIVFTSGGTESLNHAFRGIFEAQPGKRHFVTTAVEHSAVQALVAWLRQHGATVTLLGVDATGRLDLGALEAALGPDTALLSVMAASNETGVLFPLEEVARIARAKGVLLHTDATQAVGRVPIDLKRLPVDLLTLSGHKLHGPKGTGALFIRRGLRLRPLLVGGQQERGRRGGTENVPGLVGLGWAAELAAQRLPEAEAIQALRDRLEAGLDPDVIVHGQGTERLPNTTLASFPGLEGEALLLKLSQAGICVSVGSACTTGQREPSHVLKALGVDPALARGTLRFSLGRGTTAEEIDRTLEVLSIACGELRAMGPMGR